MVDNADTEKTVQADAVQSSSAPSEENILETLKKENLEMQEEIRKREEMLKKREELRARELLGGRAPSTQGMPIKSPEEIKKLKAAEFFKGTELEKAILKHG